jgi:glucose-6-phosphate dehydrogenase assembly protein OpcA
MADAVAVDTWDAQGVRLSDVTAALADLRYQSIGRAAIRTAVMTLVSVIRSDEQAYAATRALRALGRHHPARIVLLRPDPDQVATLDARAALFAVKADGNQVHFEEVTLVVGGQAANHLDSLVEAFTLSDLPVPVWYVGDIPDPADQLLSVATAVIVDSRDAADSGRLRALLELARRRTVVDLSWIRLQPWRELLAGLFSPPERRPWLDGVETVEVTGKMGPRQLLGGWIMSQLRLAPSQMRLTDAQHVEIRVECRLGDETATFEVGRGRAHRTVSARYIAPAGRGGADGPAVIESGSPIPLADDPLATSLAEALTHLQPDIIWERALSAAAGFAV